MSLKETVSQENGCNYIPNFLKKMDKDIIQFQQQNVVQLNYLFIPLPRAYKILSDEDIHNASEDVSLFNIIFYMN